jgi:hypothetical protein
MQLAELYVLFALRKQVDRVQVFTGPDYTQVDLENDLIFMADRALAILEGFNALQGGIATCHLHLAVGFRLRGRLEEAKEHIDAALSIDPYWDTAQMEALDIHNLRNGLPCMTYHNPNAER